MQIVPDASPALVNAVISEEETNVTLFVKLLVKEEEDQKRKREKESGDPLVGDVSCRPG